MNLSSIRINQYQRASLFVIFFSLPGNNFTDNQQENNVIGQWYVIQNKYRKESSLYRLLEDKGFEVFYPRLRVDPVNPRSKKEKPYFPGYMFVYTDLSEVQIRTFQRMPYAIGLVSFGGVPATVPEHVIATIRNNLELDQSEIKSKKKFHQGEAVKVLSGPFSGYEGIFDKSIAGETRVHILLSLLNDKKVLLELSAADIEKSNGI